ncbi:hypothetical protein CHS0354_037973 [Potamilus streckersoni]|uniref:Uncharacterized protein n=1 Tax=Potamilus streckersoni TaxID=2493646 RepID=A0AAE0T9E1_9BIVA|nr:hypothetical protein CHS0354_037973 [Potamilus streckersoni]
MHVVYQGEHHCHYQIFSGWAFLSLIIDTRVDYKVSVEKEKKTGPAKSKIVLNFHYFGVYKSGSSDCAGHVEIRYSLPGQPGVK